MGEGTMRTVTISPEEIKRIQDSFVAKMNAKEMVGYVVVGSDWQSAFVNFPLGQPGVAYTWTRAWKGRAPRAAIPAGVTVATSHISDADTLRGQLNAPANGAAATPVAFSNGRTDVALASIGDGRLTAELIDGETFILVIAHGGEESLRIAPVTDRTPLIANWLTL